MANNLITFHRGDTANFHFHRSYANGTVIMERADRIYFTVKERGKEAEPNFVLQKKNTDFTFDEAGEYHFTITPADTNNLVFEKVYSYDIEVITGGVKTTIGSGDFVLKKEVTTQADEGE